MNVAEAMAIARSPVGLQTATRRAFAAEVLALKVLRLESQIHSLRERLNQSDWIVCAEALRILEGSS